MGLKGIATLHPNLPPELYPILPVSLDSAPFSPAYLPNTHKHAKNPQTKKKPLLYIYIYIYIPGLSGGQSFRRWPKHMCFVSLP